MILKDNLELNAKVRLQEGIRKVANEVGNTMGTGGSNTTIEAIENPGYLTTNDGFTIASAIKLADPVEDIGRKMLLEAINRANKSSGDGSSTTCVLTSSIIKEGLKVEGQHPMDIKRSLEECLPTIVASLESQARQIVDGDAFDVGLLEQVATISAEDPIIGKTIAEIYQKIGKSGLIYWDVSKTSEDSYTVGNGITVDGAGYLSPYMCDITESGQNTGQVRLKNPRILITKQKISSANDFNEIGGYLNEKDIKDLVVFADEVDPLVVPDLLKTRVVRGFRFVIVKMPVLWKDWWYEDLAKATGATVIDPEAGLSLRDLNESHLGKVSHMVVTRTDTELDGIKDVSAHVKSLEEAATDEGKLRASRLNTKTARYFVGAYTDAALSYRRLKVEDAISASYQALQGGIVAGGGSALLHAIHSLPDSLGGNILKSALTAPFEKICENAGAEISLIDTVMWEGVKGLDTKTKEVVDMFKAGIIDPKNVVLNAVKNALSVASTVITAPNLITLPREEMMYPMQMPPNLIQN